jgi:quercetin dioxygenase-like cupin family protein
MKHGSIETIEWKERLTFLKAIPFGEDDFKSKGTKFQIIKFAPGSEVKAHHHNEKTEMFYVAQGTGKVIINKEGFRVKPGEFFLCETGDSHSFVNDTEKDFVILVFRTNEKKDDLIFE